MRPSVILDVVVRLVFPSALVLAAYLLFAGHNQPGGGFIGGLVAGAAFALRYVSGGTKAVHDAVRVQPWTVLGTGMVFTTATALVPLVFGGSLLESEVWVFHLGVLGEPHLASAFFFDLGIFLIVVGMVLMLFEAFGEPMRGEEAA